MMNTPRFLGDLNQRSIEVIRDGQHASGGYVASPTFSQYPFSWLRDGSYIAMAMAATGDRDSSARFYDWVARVVLAHEADVQAVIADLAAGKPADPAHLLPARFTLEGEREPRTGEDDWPNFQLDGYGTWLFGLHSHYAGVLPEGRDDLRVAVELTVAYLRATWHLPCYDYWEEFGDRQHTSTLAAIVAGLQAAAVLLHDESVQELADEVWQYVLDTCVVDGSFVKGPQDDRVDASLLSLAVPFGLVTTSDATFERTLARIRSELSSPTGGIRRYVGDTYYGGSPWILHTAWLGWVDRIAGNAEAAAHAKAWIEECALPESGFLPEQRTSEPQEGAEAYVQEWEERWGTVATPLLWSHAKYLLLQFGAVTAW